MDAFPATHGDSDRYGGIDQVPEEGIAVSACYDRGEGAFPAASNRSQNQYRQYDSGAGSSTRLMRGDEIELDPEVSAVVAASNGHVRGAVGEDPIDRLDENGYSVVLLVSYNGFNSFVAGDLTPELEERIVREAAGGHVDAYRVSQHGSETRSSGPSSERSAPRRWCPPALAAASTTPGERCRTRSWPPPPASPSTRQSRTFTTHRAGSLQNSPIPDLESADADGTGWEGMGGDGTVSVAVAANSFEVRMPARGIPRTYAVERE